MPTEQPQTQPQTERVSTGIPGLDHILGGGFPKNHMYLIEGEAGAGKTTVGLQFLLDGLAKGERTLWVTMSETERELEGTARSHGWTLNGIEILNLVVSDEMSRAEGKYTFFSPADVELNETTKALIEAIERVKPSRLVFDPFSDIKLLARDPLRYRRQVLSLREFMQSKECTALLMQEATRGAPGDQQAEAITHGYITLHLDSPEYGGQRRRLRVHKMRGIPFRDGYHDFSIQTGGVEVYPRLIASDYYEEPPTEMVPSGVATLDSLLGGGLERGTSLLILGPAGVGKSTLTSLFATTAANRGEKSAIFVFDETVRAFRRRGDKLGMDVSGHMKSGNLVVRQVYGAELTPGQFTHVVMQAVEDDGVKIIGIDSLTGYLSAMPEERFLSTHLHELLSYLSHKNVVTILTLAQHGVLGEHVESPVDVSYLTDDVLLVRYFEAFGAIRRAASVVKKRSGEHETSVREITIGASGIQVGNPLTDFSGVLTGHIQYSGKMAELATGSGGERLQAEG